MPCYAVEFTLRGLEKGKSGSFTSLRNLRLNCGSLVSFSGFALATIFRNQLKSQAPKCFPSVLQGFKSFYSSVTNC